MGLASFASRIRAKYYCSDQTTSSSSKLEIQSHCASPCRLVELACEKVYQNTGNKYKIRPPCADDVRLERGPTWSELHMQCPAEERGPVQQLHGVRRRHLVLVDGEAERLLFPLRIFGDLGPDQGSRLRREVYNFVWRRRHKLGLTLSRLTANGVSRYTVNMLQASLLPNVSVWWHNVSGHRANGKARKPPDGWRFNRLKCRRSVEL